MPTVDRKTHRLHFETLGRDDAAPLLLVMGMGFSSRAWATLPQRLADRYRVIVFDNRGTGRSTAPRGLYRTSDLAADAAAVLDAAGARSAFVFGISMGGMVALELALRHPGRVRALVLGATFASWLRSRKLRIPALSDLLVGGVSVGLGASASRLGRLLVSRTALENDFQGFVRWLGEGERARPAVAVQQLAAVVTHAAASRLSRLSVPTLVISGDEDRMVPVANSRRLAEEIRGARLVILRGAGHCFPLERTEETMQALTAFLGEQERPADWQLPLWGPVDARVGGG